MRIIPAIDIINGQCVRLEEGDYSRSKVYRTDPLAVAAEFEHQGVEYLHLVDLDGAKAGKLVNTAVIERICSQTGLTVDVGGGIKSSDDLKAAFEAGAAQVNIGSLAVKNPDLFTSWIEEFGGEKILLSADAKDGFVAINGWQTVTDIPLEDFIQDYLDKGITTVVCTDIAKDGMMQGPSLDLYGQLIRLFPQMKLIASGGVTTVADVEKVKSLGVDGVIIGKALYEGTIQLHEILGEKSKE